MVCAAIGQARRLAGRAAPAAGCSSCSARFGSSTTSAAACSAPSPGSRSAGPSARCSSISRARPSCATTPRTRRSSRRLNQELPPHRLIDTLAQIDPFATLAGPAAGVEPPDPAVLDSAGVSSCGAQRRARRRQRLRARHRGLGLGRGQRARRHQRPRRCRDRHAARRPQRRRPARRAGRLVRQDQRRRRPPRRRAARARRCSSPTPRRGHPAGCSATRATAPTRRRPSASAASCRSSAATRTATSRSAARVTTIRGVIRSGNSGGPVVDAQGRVITTVFAQRVGHGRRLRRPEQRGPGSAREGGQPSRVETSCTDR